jgi:hypothetical protein
LQPGGHRFEPGILHQPSPTAGAVRFGLAGQPRAKAGAPKLAKPAEAGNEFDGPRGVVPRMFFDN